MARLKVEGHVGLVRDKISNAIVNTNKSDYDLYMKRIKARESQRDEMTSMVKEINRMIFYNWSIPNLCITKLNLSLNLSSK